MSLPTCSVTCIMHGQDGEPEPGASFEFRLNRYEVYEGFVVPEIMRGVADETGSCVLDLWPNQLGTTESVYDVTMRSTTGKTQRITASVPNEVTANLHDIAMLPPYPGKPDFQAQMDAAIEAKQSAVAAMDTTLEARDVTLAARDAAQSSEDDATAQAVIATTQAGIATTKAAEAAASAVLAATFDPALFVPKAGGVTMTGTLAVPAGATGSNVPRASEVVPNTGDTTIAGIKTFSSSPVVPAGATGSQAPRRSEVVGNTGDETIAGIKTFSSAPLVPAGASGLQAVAAQEVVGLTGSMGSAKVPAGTTAQRDGSPAAGYTRYNSTLGCNETYNGTLWVPEGIQNQATVATTSGTSIDITGIPAGIKRLIVKLVGVSTNGTSDKVIRLGTSGGVVSTGYQAGAGVFDATTQTASAGVTTGFVLLSVLAADAVHGTLVFDRHGADTWNASGSVHMSTRNAVSMAMGSVALGAALDRIRITTVGGTDAFDGGAFSISWEF